MRRLWMSVLLAVVLALMVPVAADAATSAPAAPAAPQTLKYGQKSAAIKALQQRLEALHYYPGAINGVFGTNTLEAVWAFQRSQGLPGESYVNAAMQRALAHPKAPRVLNRKAGANRIEVNLSTEVLVLYKNNQIQLVSHVSTGGGYYYCSPGGGCGVARTPTGVFHTRSFYPGWIQVPLGEMYNSVFFIGTAYAIHGDTYVPLNAASHGCVRLPMDVASFFHKLVKVPGEAVVISR
jgi:peptidoglycan hydrolase-like protein with peptidoglycan-binding domain